MRSLALLLLVSAIPVAVRAQAADTILAVDLGAHLEPIAQMRNGEWVPIGPGGLGRLGPRDWTRWSPAGRASRLSLAVREPTGRCARPRRLPVTGTASGAQASAPAGIAASGPLDVVPLRNVDASSPAHKMVHAAVTPLFERREREHGLSPEAFARVPVTLDRLFASGTGSGSTYYFEASKRVADAGNTPDEDPRGIVRLTVSGWLRTAGGRLVPAGTKGELHWDPLDDRQDFVWEGLLPLGVFAYAGAEMWVMHGDSGVRESFSMYAVGESVRAVLTVEASSC